MRYLALSLIMISSSAFACWNIKGSLSVNGSEVKINQKINHDQTYSFSKDKYIFNLKIPSAQNLPTNIPVKTRSYLVLVDVLEKEKLNLKTIANGQIIANDGQEVTMTKNDAEAQILTKMKLSVTEI